MYQVISYKPGDHNCQYAAGQRVGTAPSAFSVLKERTNTLYQSLTTEEPLSYYSRAAFKPKTEITYNFPEFGTLNENSCSVHQSALQPGLTGNLIDLPPITPNSSINPPAQAPINLLDSSVAQANLLPLQTERPKLEEHDLDELEFELTMPGTKDRSKALNSYPAPATVEKRMPVPIIPFIDIEGPSYAPPVYSTEPVLADRITGFGNQEEPSKVQEVAKRSLFGAFVGGVSSLWYWAVSGFFNFTFPPLGWTLTGIGVIGFIIGFFKGPEAYDYLIPDPDFDVEPEKPFQDFPKTTFSYYDNDYNYQKLED